MAGRPALYQLIDYRLDGRLADVLRDYDRSELSLENITYALRSEHNVTVSSATVRRWIGLVREKDCAAEPS